MAIREKYAIEVDDVLAKAGDAIKTDSVKNLALLVASSAPTLDASGVGVLDEMMVRVLSTAGEDARISAAEVLADVPRAPRGTVMAIALDPSPAVSGPMIARSQALNPADLQEIAMKGRTEHMLALAARPNLPDGAAEVLISRGEDAVIRAVAGNQTAKVAYKSMSKLVGVSERDPVLRNILARRKDVRPEHARILAEAACAEAADVVTRETGVSVSTEAEALASHIVAGIAMRMEALGKLPTGASKAVSAIAEPKRSDIIGFLKAGMTREALLCLARTAEASPCMGDYAHASKDSLCLVILMRASRQTFDLMKVFLVVRAGGVPSTDQLKEAHQDFTETRVETAREVVAILNAWERRLNAPPEERRTRVPGMR